MDLKTQHVAELISLGLTVPTLVLSAAVVYYWSASIHRAPKTANEWFITGVVVGFLGAFLDNTYWFLPWTASFLELDAKEELINAGVYFNIFFRQGLGTYAAYCHLKAAELSSEKSFKVLNMLVFTSVILGCFYAALIIFLSGQV